MGRCTKNIHAQAIASQWFDSGMTQTEYARQNNLSIHSLKYWLYKKEKEKRCKEAGFFVDLKNIPGGNSIIMKYLNGVELQFPAGTPVQILAKISPQARRGSPDGYEVAGNFLSVRMKGCHSIGSEQTRQAEYAGKNGAGTSFRQVPWFSAGCRDNRAIGRSLPDC